MVKLGIAIYNVELIDRKNCFLKSLSSKSRRESKEILFSDAERERYKNQCFVIDTFLMEHEMNSWENPGMFE